MNINEIQDRAEQMAADVKSKIVAFEAKTGVELDLHIFHSGDERTVKVTPFITVPRKKEVAPVEVVKP